MPSTQAGSDPHDPGSAVHRHLTLLRRSAEEISASLDVTEVAQGLVNVLVPGLGDLASVEFAQAVMEGDEPALVLSRGDQHLVRAAGTAVGGWPEGLLPPGKVFPPLPEDATRAMVQRGNAIITDRAGAISAVGPENERIFCPEGGHALAVAPLWARGLLLGIVAVWRIEQPGPFREDERLLLTEITSRAALAVDNARRFTRERRASAALQERLLPLPVRDTPAAETAASYRSARGEIGVGGDWFDAIPLPCLRVALVVGDVIGHGLGATAEAGRLRTIIQTLAHEELEPDELLLAAEDRVQQLAREAVHRDSVGATCLVALHDPLSGQCTIASAGHPPPFLVEADGSIELVDVSPGPPLGVGGLPFEVSTIELRPGSVLALYTDGLIRRDHSDLDHGMQQLHADLRRLGMAEHPERPLAEFGADLLEAVDPRDQADDIALLLARTRLKPGWETASWQHPARAEAVADARRNTMTQLAAWGLDELSYVTELIVSELVTNSIRYAAGPIVVRLIREHGLLTTEVSDPSNSQPRLRRALTTDEGGRGLFLVAQLAERWGSRYRQVGKTIWAQQPVDEGPSPASPEMPR